MFKVINQIINSSQTNYLLWDIKVRRGNFTGEHKFNFVTEKFEKFHTVTVILFSKFEI